jgi:hypothetical protein
MERLAFTSLPRMRLSPRKSGSQLTHRWRKPDSNTRSRCKWRGQTCSIRARPSPCATPPWI